MKRFLFKVYAQHVRPYTSMWLSYFFSWGTIKDVWSRYKDYPLEEFARIVSKRTYKSDPLGGAVDFTYTDPNYFFHTNTRYRDCDDTAHVYYLWGIHNGYSARKVIVTTKKRVIRHAHVICILEKNGEFILANYKVYRGFKSFEEAVYGVTSWSIYTKENLLWLTYFDK